MNGIFKLFLELGLIFRCETLWACEYPGLFGTNGIFFEISGPFKSSLDLFVKIPAKLLFMNLVILQFSVVVDMYHNS